MSDLKLNRGAWVVIADGEKALFMRNDGNAFAPELSVIEELKEENPPTREQGTDRPGRYNDGPSVHRSAVDEVDWHRMAKERFAESVAQHLYTCAHRGDFDHVLLVAPPLVLGEMRKKLHKEVDARVIGTLPKTLTNHAVPDIEKLLAA